jgi:hypothetical protein
MVLIGAAGLAKIPVAAAVSSSCGSGVNPVACENRQAGTPESVWDISGAGDASIQGFATDISVNAGQNVNLKIDTTADTYTIDIYRLGWYGGNGARLVKGGIVPLPGVAHNQPNCLTDPSVSLTDCGNWAVSASWAVPAAAVSGVYIARLIRSDNQGASHIPFIVRSDASTADVLFQTSDETWQAYNRYGGANFYTGSDQNMWDSPSRARKLSYNRPITTRGDNEGRDFVFANEYPAIRFLERNGYDVSYQAGVDSDRLGGLIKNHKTFLSVGHDEYWSGQQRTNVEAARDSGVNLMFLSGNEVYWRTRFAPSIDGSNTSYRTLVCYKETWDNAATDPGENNQPGGRTSTFRDPRFSAANPENALTGTMFMANLVDLPVTVTAAQGKTRLWRNTALTSMAAGQSTALAPHTVGYESDENIDNGFQPAGLINLSSTTGVTPQYLQDFGSVVDAGTTTHHLTLYRAASGALVFGAGTVQWAWGIDANHDGVTSPADSRMQQATMNMLADMKSLPSTLMPGLVAPVTSADNQAPASVITSPAAGSIQVNGAKVTVTGTASDAGGGQVAGVEVSLDGGTSWHPATGTNSWTYTGVLHGSGAGSIRSRATDDSANIQSPVAAAAVTASCPCTLFGAAVPAIADANDASPVEVGVRFTSDIAGFVTGVRFYKGAANTGSHTGSLWSQNGTRLASGTFTGETASGWQTLQFAVPVAILANTTYVASYYAPNGHYSVEKSFFYNRDYDAAPLHAQALSPTDSTKLNGVYSNGAGFPSNSYQGSNYFADVIMNLDGQSPPSVIAQTPAPGLAKVAVTAAPTVTFSKAMTAGSLTFTLKDAFGAAVTGAISYNPLTFEAAFRPSGNLQNGVLYKATVTGSDSTGHDLTGPVVWSFRTAYISQLGAPCPCTIFTDAATPANAATDDTASVELGVKFTADTDGVISGVRFYKGPQNTGPHTGTLWTASGQQLATASFSNESTSGWQTVSFASPVPVSAGATYVASYHTSVGNYSYTAGAYASSGLNNFPLHVPVGGAVFSYLNEFPGNSSNSDYGVDVIFTVQADVVPTVISTSPANASANPEVPATVSATYSTSFPDETANLTLTGAGGVNVPGTVSADAQRQTLTFTPTTPLSKPAVYTATAIGAKSLVGTVEAGPTSWTFNLGTAAPPVLTTTGSSLAYTENATSLLDSGISVSGTTLSSAAVTMTTAYVNGQDTLAFTNQNGITGTWTAGTGVLALSGVASVANYQTALRSISYNNNSHTPITATRTVTFTANDGSLASNAASRTITLTAVNDGPVNSVPGSQTTGTSAATVFSSGNGNLISISDADAGAGSVQVQLVSTNGTTTLSGGTGLSFSVGDGTADGSMTFTGTVTNVNLRLAGLSFTPAGAGAASLQIVTSDQGNTGTGGTLTDNDTIAITVNYGLFTTAANIGSGAATPTSSTYASSVYTEVGNGSDIWGASDQFHYLYKSWTGNGTIIARVTSLTNSDYNAMAGVMFRETTGAGSAHAFMNTRPVTGGGMSFKHRDSTGATSSEASTGGLAPTYWVKLTRSGNTFTGYRAPDSSGSAGTWTQQGTQSITMASTIFVGLATNSHNSGATTTATYDNVSLSAPPVLTATGSSLAYTENATSLLDSGMTATDADSTNLTSATVAMTTYVKGEDALAFTNQNGITGTWTAGTGVLALSGVASVANYQTALRSVTYNNSSHAPTTSGRTVTFTANDGASTSNTVSRMITLTAINDAPVNSVPVAQSTGTSAALIFSSGNGNLISISDADAGSSSVRVQLVSTNGTTTLSGTAGLIFTVGDGTADASMTFTGTVTNVNQTLAGLSFTPSAAGAASLQIVTNDQGNTGTGGPLTDTETIAITVNYGLFTTAANIGSGTAGPASSTFGSSVYTEVGNGSDIYNGSDQFHYLYKSWTGDGTIVTRATSLANSEYWARAAIMFRETSNTDSAQAMMGVTPVSGGGAVWGYRGATGASTSTANTGGLAPTLWLKLVRSGNTFTGYTAPDSAGSPGTWTRRGVQSIPMASTVLVGLATLSHNTSVTTRATYDNVSVAANNYGLFSTAVDIGSGSAGPTSSTFASSAYTEVGNGSDIYNSSDQFHYLYKSWTGDGSIIARVTALGNTDANARAAVMFRETTSTGSAEAMMGVHPAANNTVTFGHRDGTGLATVANATGGFAPTIWLKLVRSGNTFTGYTAPDSAGSPGTWTRRGVQSIPMASTILVGLATLSHSSTAVTTATYDGVSLS